MKKVIFGSLIMAVAFTACKKNDDNASIVGKWNGVNNINTKYNNDTPSLDTTSTVGTYLEFTSDGKVYGSDTSSYTVSGNNLYLTYKDGAVTETDTLEIHTLDNHNLSLYVSEMETVNGKQRKYETWVNFSR